MKHVYGFSLYLFDSLRKLNFKSLMKKYMHFLSIGYRIIISLRGFYFFDLIIECESEITAARSSPKNSAKTMTAPRTPPTHLQSWHCRADSQNKVLWYDSSPPNHQVTYSSTFKLIFKDNFLGSNTNHNTKTLGF